MDNNVHPNVGLGINLVEFGEFVSDLFWNYFSGDVQMVELVFVYKFYHLASNVRCGNSNHTLRYFILS
ncbi:hypothetical protein GCM10007916_11910 [Psychromonas marina]|uniref:Uncharacterized protein n=1 Tax=Psychromonas marina TaxID=88364 RepID=A0ABQ6DY79_9GAMM|nr:hypothetical protein GCM10007916_11910 [Psychromonas marina]